jgi:hypothetical protein
MRIAIAAPAPKQPRKLVWYLMAFPRDQGLCPILCPPSIRNHRNR